jgi:hypothetical protein
MTAIVCLPAEEASAIARFFTGVDATRMVNVLGIQSYYLVQRNPIVSRHLHLADKRQRLLAVAK